VADIDKIYLDVVADALSDLKGDPSLELNEAINNCLDELDIEHDAADEIFFLVKDEIIRRTEHLDAYDRCEK
tara:strand:- start:1213 stop:1428 length:216 start_codon:yes stop_codon:yes gene_type:complete